MADVEDAVKGTNEHAVRVTNEEELSSLTLRLVQRALPEPRPFSVRLWDGSELPAARQPPRATLVLREPGALSRMLEPPLDLSAGEAFLRGDFEVEGELEAVFEVLENFGSDLGPMDLAGLAKEAASLRLKSGQRLSGLMPRLRGRRHSKERDRQAISHHYDVSNDFYGLWLDGRLVYSCGYFPQGTESLDEAQEAKLEHICRKLRLEPGDRLLDIGCGWGSLVLYAAERHGVEALGVTLSEQQLDEARRRIREAGLDDRVVVELQDYRDVTGSFDKIASVGMAEHVGRKQLGQYFRHAFERLAPGGLMLNHAISRGIGVVAGRRGLISGEFTQRYVFPDGELLQLWETLQFAEEQGFEVRDVENLREHYAQTLRHWVANLERNWEAAKAEVGLERARLWRLFMSGSAYQFAFGRLSLHQSLLAKPDSHGRVNLPASRAHLYP